MKHCKKGRQFNRNSSQRKALLSSMMSSLFVYGSIQTTEAKAKELKGEVDKVITKAKNSNGSSVDMFRKLESNLSRLAITKLKDLIVDRLKDRDSGYTRVIKVSPRKSDGSRLAIIEFVDHRKK